MNLTKACRFFPAVAATVGALLIVQWLGFTRASVAIDRRDPGPDRSAQASVAAVDLNGSLVKGEGAAGKTGDPWPGFRGPNRDNINTEKLKLSRAPAGGTLPRLWQIDVGEGYAGPSVSEGRVYILDYDEVGRGEAQPAGKNFRQHIVQGPQAGEDHSDRGDITYAVEQPTRAIQPQQRSVIGEFYR